jgi:hypothetical protein
MGIPLKNIGFHIYNGAIPHFKKIENNNINQHSPNEKISFTLLTVIKYINMCSLKYQSNVNILK